SHRQPIRRIAQLALGFGADDDLACLRDRRTPRLSGRCRRQCVMAEAARAGRKAFDLRHHRSFPTIAVLCLVFLYAPIALLLIYSFNSSSSLTNFQGFSIDWY